MHEYHIEGGIPIKGTVRASGNKNAALPCIAAALLTEEPVVLRNIPQIADTGVMDKDGNYRRLLSGVSEYALSGFFFCRCPASGQAVV